MPLIPLNTNPLMEMRDQSAVLSIAEKALGVSCVIVMLFLVRRDAKWFSLATTKEVVFWCGDDGNRRIFCGLDIVLSRRSEFAADALRLGCFAADLLRLYWTVA